MNCDALITWPINVDFPLFREQIKKYRGKFNKVIIVFSNHYRDRDYREFIKEAMKDDEITFIDFNLDAGKDWRSQAVNEGLKVSDSEWVFFTEQDFDIKDGFWEQVEENLESDVIGAFQESRLHPCCIFIKRSLIDQTSKDFGAYPEKGLDHFDFFYKELRAIKPLNNYIISTDYYIHLNGLTHNMDLMQSGEKPNYAVSRFRQYLRDCLKVKPLPSDFRKTVREYLNKL